MKTLNSWLGDASKELVRQLCIFPVDVPSHMTSIVEFAKKYPELASSICLYFPSDEKINNVSEELLVKLAIKFLSKALIDRIKENVVNIKAITNDRKINVLSIGTGIDALLELYAISKVANECKFEFIITLVEEDAAAVEFTKNIIKSTGNPPCCTDIHYENDRFCQDYLLAKKLTNINLILCIHPHLGSAKRDRINGIDGRNISLHERPEILIAIQQLLKSEQTEDDCCVLITEFFKEEHDLVLRVIDKPHEKCKPEHLAFFRTLHENSPWSKEYMDEVFGEKSDNKRWFASLFKSSIFYNYVSNPSGTRTTMLASQSPHVENERKKQLVHY